MDRGPASAEAAAGCAWTPSSPDRKTIEWGDVPPETLPGVLATHERVCWNCHVAKTFHDQFPDRVTERRPPSARRAS